ncbi:exosortase C-terminal domain/associated protein EpsI [Methylophilus sp. 3sh_L]|uniref:exosortase C-terminal domain/associated protein EpsI n=1 Tax=Methylophilus sp. 3sh_L TaxID=3377114 RepID=UPI00398EC0FD
MKDLYLKLPPIGLITGGKFLVVSLICLFLAISLKPNKHYANQSLNFEQSIPRVVGSWVEVQQATPQVNVVSDEKTLINQLYDDTLMRTYADAQGHQVMVALAYAKEQRQDVKIHQPDVCYPAQGYQLIHSELKQFTNLGSRVPVFGKQQLYHGQNHYEAVSYWIRVGDRSMTSGLQMRLKIIQDGLLKRRLDDGILVRVSTVVADESQVKEAYAIQEKFLFDFVRAVEQQSSGLLLPN